MGVLPQDMLVVGDFEFDIEAGRSAGAITAFLTNGAVLQCRVPADHTIATIGEVADIVQLSRPLAQGKLPNRWLRLFLREMDIVDPSLLIPPGVGEDVAAVDAGGEEVLVLKSDPVTFVTDDAASYAITVNANDIATSGGTPRWLLVSLMFPPGSTAASVRSVMSALARLSRLQGLVLCGGHTEITDAVTRPVIVGSVVGTVRRERLIRKERMRPGDRLLITKAIAIEGTCIIAREFPHRLREAGMSEEDIERCRSLLRKPGLSIVTEARIAADSGKVTAMHDVTEGGLATALLELGAAGGHRLRIDSRRIPILEETRRICGVLGLNPLGLIGSGSLLICCAPDACEHLIREVRRSGIGIECIGEVLEAGCGIEPSDGKTWPDFEVDELTRLFGAVVHAPGPHGA
jgi:hydrogenase maturation factor